MRALKSHEMLAYMKDNNGRWLLPRSRKLHDEDWAAAESLVDSGDAKWISWSIDAAPGIELRRIA